MELKTKVTATDNKQELIITREFDLPLALLFTAYITPEIIEEWMGTKVLKLENEKHGSYHFETTDPKGNKFGLNGVIHEFIPNQKITRTFEMANTSMGVQLEFLEFESLTEDTSKLTMHIIYRSAAQRDQYLQIGMAKGMNMAHNRLQNVVSKLK
ncbi:SRPBCC family protein [Chitinophaga nivalis]|uniref:SRPBCC domain-containing protein n=1 Tax=Chitinophaga nivalis TaxID=2991709 RepID=A0ABT3ITG8_9BACT|nr:SRPBCC domain-containing protein [Chitinophaga nivalis]MCW3463023.1 SRPBCC domain-containing protein [Chitinophaga nivalis]MCW3487287.1 SRPBCC domain-containing protein [Chitinophaga nivalis]